MIPEPYATIVAVIAGFALVVAGVAAIGWILTELTDWLNK